MFDTHVVQIIALDNGLYELLEYIEYHRSEYTPGIIVGFEVNEESST